MIQEKAHRHGADSSVLFLTGSLGLIWGARRISPICTPASHAPGDAWKAGIPHFRVRFQQLFKSLAGFSEAPKPVRCLNPTESPFEYCYLPKSQPVFISVIRHLNTSLHPHVLIPQLGSC